MTVKNLEVNKSWFRENKSVITVVITGFLVISGLGISFNKNKVAVTETPTSVTKVIEQKPEVEVIHNNTDSITVSVNEVNDAVISVQRGAVSRSGDIHSYVQATPSTDEGVKFTRGIGQGEFKSFMDYQMIDTRSVQGRYIADNMIVQEDGLLVDNKGYIGVAMGSYYGPIGSKYEIKLSSGNIFKVVKVEAKSDRHTYSGCVDRNNGSMIEFVVETDYMNNGGEKYNEAFVKGSFDVIPQFNGTIMEVKAITPEMEKKKVEPNNGPTNNRKFDFKEVAIKPAVFNYNEAQAIVNSNLKASKESLQELRNLLLARQKEDIENGKTLKLTIS